MIHSQSVPSKFWGEAMQTAVYVLNRTLFRILDRTPYESWFNTKSSFSHLFIFGCPAYIYAEKHTRTKLDPKSQPGLFMGYSDTSKAYRIWDLTKEKIVVTRDVIFHKTLFPSVSLPLPPVSSSPAPVTVFFPKSAPLSSPSTSSIAANLSTLFVSPSPTTSANLSVLHSFSDLFASPILSSSSSPPAPSTSPNSLNPILHTRPISELLADSLDAFTEIDPQDLLDLMLSSRSHRPIKLPNRYGNWAYFSAIADDSIIEPQTITDALSSINKDQWILALKEEFNSLIQKKTWELTPLPPSHTAISCKWTYRLKYDSSGQISRFKARLVARGFTQRYGIDYTETFSPVAKFDVIRTFLSLVAIKNYDLTQFDVCTAFLHGTLDEDLYMIQPPYFEDSTQPTHVCHLKKSLYGLRQASRVWNRHFTTFLAKHHFVATPQDPCLYKTTTAPVILLAIFVDDGLIASSNRADFNPILTEMDDVFKVRIDEPDTFVGLRITRNCHLRSIFLDQTRYVERLLNKYGYTDAHPAQIPADPNVRLSLHMDTDTVTETASNFPYKNLLGSTTFAALETRPDIAFAISSVSRFSHKPIASHRSALKKIFSHLKGTKEFGISFSPSPNHNCLTVYYNADYAMDLEDRKSRSGVLLVLNNGPIAWFFRKQPCTASSTTEAEYLAAHVATKELLWERRLLEALGYPQRNPTPLFSNNQPAIRLVRNPEQHQKTKHINVPFHVIREHQANHDLNFSYISTHQQLADIFTKALAPTRFFALREAIGVHQPP
jgi:muramidase (phage lysozyme)